MKPIIFSTPMVQAILDGRKTQTRRIIKPQPDNKYQFALGYVIEGFGQDHEGFFGWGTNEYGGNIHYAKPPYQSCDVLWVRETWATVSSGIIEYKATYIEPYTGSTEIDHIGKKIIWRPSIYMPREATRIFLRVKTVRIERLQDITEEDARAEGVKGIPRSRELYSSDDYIYPFKQLWNSLNAKRGYGWDTNPWVWVIEV